MNFYLLPTISMKKTSAVLALLSLLFLAAGCAPTASKEPSKPVVKINVDTWLGYAPLHLAKEKGFFKDIDVEIIVTPDVAQRKLLIATGENQAIAETLDTTVLDRSQGIKTVAVAQMDVSNGADGLVATQNIKTIQDLVGKNVAVQFNYVSQLMLHYVLDKAGIDFKKVNMQDTEAGAAGAAFVAGKVDAAVTFEPWLSKAKTRNGGHVLFSSKDVPGVVVDVLAFRDDYIKEHRSEVLAVVRGWSEAVQYWKDHPQEANEIMAKAYDLPVADFADQISGLIWPSPQESIAYFGTEKTAGSAKTIIDTFVRIFLKTGQVTSQPDLAGITDSSLLQELYGGTQ